MDEYFVLMNKATVALLKGNSSDAEEARKQALEALKKAAGC